MNTLHNKLAFTGYQGTRNLAAPPLEAAHPNVTSTPGSILGTGQY